MIIGYHRDMIYHTLIDLDEDLFPIDFEFTRLKSRSQLSLVKNIKNWFLFIISRTVYYRAFIFQMQIGLTLLIFTRTNVNVNFVKNIHNIFRSLS